MSRSSGAEPQVERATERRLYEASTAAGLAAFDDDEFSNELTAPETAARWRSGSSSIMRSTWSPAWSG
ncbi:MAG: hypothetical protein ACRDT8_23210 [Micromonosporaceae bacterium]